METNSYVFGYQEVVVIALIASIFLYRIGFLEIIGEFLKDIHRVFMEVLATLALSISSLFEGMNGQSANEKDDQLSFTGVVQNIKNDLYQNCYKDIPDGLKTLFLICFVIVPVGMSYIFVLSCTMNVMHDLSVLIGIPSATAKVIWFYIGGVGVFGLLVIAFSVGNNVIRGVSVYTEVSNHITKEMSLGDLSYISFTDLMTYVRSSIVIAPFAIGAGWLLVFVALFFNFLFPAEWNEDSFLPVLWLICHLFAVFGGGFVTTLVIFRGMKLDNRVWKRFKSAC